MGLKFLRLPGFAAYRFGVDGSVDIDHRNVPHSRSDASGLRYSYNGAWESSHWDPPELFFNHLSSKTRKPAQRPRMHTRMREEWGLRQRYKRAPKWDRKRRYREFIGVFAPCRQLEGIRRSPEEPMLARNRTTVRVLKS